MYNMQLLDMKLRAVLVKPLEELHVIYLTPVKSLLKQY